MRIFVIASLVVGGAALSGCAHHDSAARAEMYGTPPGYMEASSKPPKVDHPAPQTPVNGESGAIVPEAPPVDVPPVNVP